MYKNVASQYIYLEAWDTGTSTAKTGDAANITAYLEKDAGGAVQTNDVAPTEVDATNMPGIYRFTMTQAETNADLLSLKAKSTTANVVLASVTIYTKPGTNAGVLSTTVATVADQTHFTLTDGADVDDTYKHALIVLYDTTNNSYPSIRRVTAYTGATKTVTINAAADFTIAPADGAKIFVVRDTVITH